MLSIDSSELSSTEKPSVEMLNVAKEQLLEASATKTMMDFISVDKFSFQTEDALPSRPRFIGNSNSECLLQCLGYLCKRPHREGRLFAIWKKYEEDLLSQIILNRY